MKKRIFAIIIAFILVYAVIYNVTAETTSDYKQQIENAENQLESVNTQIDSTMQEIEDLNSSIYALQDEISELQTKIDGYNTSIEEKQKDLDEKQGLLDQRLSAAYMKGNNTYVDALFSKGIINFLSNYEMIKQIAEYDGELINQIKDVKTQLENERSALSDAKSEKEQKSNEYQTLKTEKEAKVSALTDEQKQIESQIEEYDQQMQILSAKERAIAIQTAKETGQSYSGDIESVVQGGKFAWPVPTSTSITSLYGYRTHPISGTWKLHAGLDIAASTGENIVAGEAGTIMLASYGYNGGYGNYVVINHGNGITTRYAHCSQLYVSTGDTVTRGQVIAAVGSTGASTGSHCHFEVRIDGDSTNPLNYL